MIDTEAVSWVISEFVKPALTNKGEHVVAFYNPTEFVFCIPSDEKSVGELTVRFQELFVRAIERYELMKTSMVKNYCNSCGHCLDCLRIERSKGTED